jgi:nucleoside phosphorylase
MDIDVGIVVALPVELAGVLNSHPLGREAWQRHSGSGGFIQYVSELETASGGIVTLSVAQQLIPGKVGAASCAAELLKSQPRLMLMTGICAGVGMELGDIAVAYTAFEHDVGKLAEIFEDQNQTFEVSRLARTELEEFIQDGIPKSVEAVERLEGGVIKVKGGSFATGSFVVANSSAVAKLRERDRKLVAIDMEASALFQFMCQTAPDVARMVVKSVSDRADQEKGDEFHEYCSEVSARWAISFIDKSIHRFPMRKAPFMEFRVPLDCAGSRDVTFLSSVLGFSTPDDGPLVGSHAVRIYPISARTFLVEVAIDFAAYQGNIEFFLVSAAEETWNWSRLRLPVVEFDGRVMRFKSDDSQLGLPTYDDLTRKLSVFEKVRGPGDCGELRVYQMHGTYAELIEVRSRSEADAKRIGQGEIPPEEWPSLDLSLVKGDPKTSWY